MIRCAIAYLNNIKFDTHTVCDQSCDGIVNSILRVTQSSACSIKYQ